MYGECDGCGEEAPLRAVRGEDLCDHCRNGEDDFDDDIEDLWYPMDDDDEIEDLFDRSSWPPDR